MCVSVETGLDRLLGTAQSAFAIDHQCEVPVRAAEPAVGSQLAQSKSKVAGSVCSDSERLASNWDPPSSPAC